MNKQYKNIEADLDYAKYDNAQIGEGTLVEPNVSIGHRYHKNCGPAIIGKKSILRAGTIIYGDVTTGDYFQTAHNVVVRAKVKIGDYCCVLNNSVLEGIINMGIGVRVMSNVYIPSRTDIGNHVFIGPGVTFLNDKYPARIKHEPEGAKIEDDVIIGGGCTILPGITIGERSFIAAGSVVTKNIPSESLVMGVPGTVKPLPEQLDKPNNRKFTMQKKDIWHPDSNLDEKNVSDYL